jgi:hypothetical protein
LTGKVLKSSHLLNVITVMRILTGEGFAGVFGSVGAFELGGDPAFGSDLPGGMD